MTTPGLVDEDGIPVSYNPVSAVYSTVGVTGITGATANSRYAGATVSGPPASGTSRSATWCPTRPGRSGSARRPGRPDLGAVRAAESAQLSGWLASTIDPMAVSAATGSASLPANDTFVGGLIYLPVPVSSTGMSLVCVAAERRHRQPVLGRARPRYRRRDTLTATAATADSHASIAATTPFDLAWASGPIAVPAGYYYLGYAATWATDAPTFLGGLASATPTTRRPRANIVDNQQAQAENLPWGAGGFRWISQP